MAAKDGIERFVASIEARLFPTLHRIAEEPHMAAVREAMGPSFIGLIVATIIAFFLPPEPTLQTLYSTIATRFFAAYHVGFGAMGIVLVVILSDRLACAFDLYRPLVWVLALGAFVSALRWPLDRTIAAELGDISSTSILLGLVVALTVVELLRFGRSRIGGAAGYAIGTAASILLFGGFAALHVSLGDVLLAVIRPLVAVGDTLPGLLLVVFFQTLLWTAGVHGPAFLSGIVTPIFLKALDENSQAVAAHQAPPHIVTFMLSVFYYPGGSGATLPLALLMLRSRVQRLRKLALAAIVPSLWNVNEMLIFGVPLVMNPSLSIPFLAVPLVLATITYVATWLGLVGHTVVYYPPLFPSIISAWLTTGDWRAVVLVCVNVLVGVLLYRPFLKAYENMVLAAPAEDDELVRSAEAIRQHELELAAHRERASGAQPPARGQSSPPPAR